jgi:LTXXQ motif family protein
MVRAIVRTGSLVAAAGLLSVLTIMPGQAGQPIVLAQAQPGAQAPGGQPPNIETSIVQLRQRLRPTPAQQAEFNALAAAMREMPNSPPPAGNMSAVQSVQAQIQMMQQALASMQRTLQALDALYAKLSPPQRHVVDQFFGPEPQR